MRTPRGRRGRRSKRWTAGGGPAVASAVAALALASAVSPPPSLGAQEGEAAEAVTPDSADVIRRSLERPPPRPGFDVVDALSLPFRAIAMPLIFIGQGGAEVIGAISEVQPVLRSALQALGRVGLSPAVGAIGPRSGVAARMRVTRLRPLYLESAVSIRESQRHRAGLRLSRPTWTLDVGYRFQRNAQVLFWGIGSQTPESAESDYLRDISEAAAAGTIDLGRVELTAGAAFEDNRVGRPLDDDRSDDLQTSFTGRLPFGVEERTNYVRGRLGAALDLTAIADRLQRRGVYLQAGAAIFRGVDGTASDFHRFDGRASGYLPLNIRQTLAVQLLTEINRDDGGGVPFYHLASLGDARGARAFTSERFRDRDLLALMAEWRYEVWRELHERGRLEGFVFFDEGGVARRLTELDGGDLHESYGFGLRGVWGGRLVALGYLAFGGEGARFQAAFEWAY